MRLCVPPSFAHIRPASLSLSSNHIPPHDISRCMRARARNHILCSAARHITGRIPYHITKPHRPHHLLTCSAAISPDSQARMAGAPRSVYTVAGFGLGQPCREGRRAAGRGLICCQACPGGWGRAGCASCGRRNRAHVQAPFDAYELPRKQASSHEHEGMSQTAALATSRRTCPGLRGAPKDTWPYSSAGPLRATSPSTGPRVASSAPREMSGPPESPAHVRPEGPAGGRRRAGRACLR
jgi:hypothetical protein